MTDDARHRTMLEREFEALCAEIRAYPTPIARCDEQLAALIEQRSRLHALLREAPHPAGGCAPDAVWINDGGFHAA